MGVQTSEIIIALAICKWRDQIPLLRMRYVLMIKHVIWLHGITYVNKTFLAVPQIVHGQCASWHCKYHHDNSII